MKCLSQGRNDWDGLKKGSNQWPSSYGTTPLTTPPQLSHCCMTEESTNWSSVINTPKHTQITILSSLQCKRPPCQSRFVPQGLITYTGQRSAHPLSPHISIAYQCLCANVQAAGQRLVNLKRPLIRFFIRRCYYGSLDQSVLCNEDH